MALIATLGALAVGAAGAGASEVVYDNIPSPLPGNFVSLTGAARKNPNVTVVMSTWACQSGGVYQDTCETAKPSKK